MAKPKTSTKPPSKGPKRVKYNQPWYQSINGRSLLAAAVLVIALIFASTLFTGNKSTPRKGKSTPKKAATPPADPPKREPPILAQDPSIPKIQPPTTPNWKRTGTGAEKGVVATEDISVGDLLFYVDPLLTVPANDNRTSPTAEILSGINDLPSTEREKFFNLPYNAFKLPENHSPEDLALNIWEANAVHAGATSSLFIDTAYITHSCLPNADYFYREDIKALVVHAVMPIAKGEEIACPYFDASVLTRDERQEFMHGTRGEPCNCHICTSYEGQKLEESDKNRNRLGEIKGMIQAYGRGEAEPEAVLEAIEEAYELLKKEEYAADLGWWGGTAVQIGAAHADPITVMKWATITKPYYETEAGRDSPQAASLGILANEPFRSSAWGMRDPRWMTGEGEPPEQWTKMVEDMASEQSAKEEAQAAWEEAQAATEGGFEAEFFADEDIPEQDTL